MFSESTVSSLPPLVIVLFFTIQVQFTQRNSYDSRLYDKSNQSAASKGNILWFIQTFKKSKTYFIMRENVIINKGY